MTWTACAAHLSVLKMQLLPLPNCQRTATFRAAAVRQTRSTHPPRYAKTPKGFAHPLNRSRCTLLACSDAHPVVMVGGRYRHKPFSINQLRAINLVIFGRTVNP